MFFICMTLLWVGFLMFSGLFMVRAVSPEKRKLITYQWLISLISIISSCFCALFVNWSSVATSATNPCFYSTKSGIQMSDFAFTLVTSLTLGGFLAIILTAIIKFLTDRSRGKKHEIRL